MCIGTSRPLYLKAAGYGQDGSGLSTNKLQKVSLKRIEIEECQEKLYSDIPLSHESQICAESYRDDLDEQQDLCYGDSGGEKNLNFKLFNNSFPFLAGVHYINFDLEEEGYFHRIPTLIALTSFGMECALALPAIYVNISYYEDWMESVIKSNND